MDGSNETSPDETSAAIEALLADMLRVREAVESEGEKRLRSWGRALDRPENAARLHNLALYLALRSQDLTTLQRRLAAFGLSSLGRSEAKVAPALEAVIATLRRLSGDSGARYPAPDAILAGDREIELEASRLFGPAREGASRTRIMATLPPEAAEDARYAVTLLEAGMSCARINCAHDNAVAWAHMIANVRAAQAKTGLSCRVLMDIGGPKCRVAEIRAPAKHRLHRGDRVELVARLDRAKGDAIAFSISFPQVIDQLEVGRAVSIDDGKARGRVVEKTAERAVIELQAAREKGLRLKPDKGLNFPDTALDLPPLTPKDLTDLDFVAAHADLVGFSFVQRVEDVTAMQDALERRRPGLPPQGLILKIETPLAVANLPRLIAAAIARQPTGVMIARGDLAVEIGFARMAEMQEELLWLCEAAHVPAVWATQVLDQFVSDGVANRSEMTDAAMAQSSECVMLNKGPHLAEGVAFLEGVLSRMDRHHDKKFSRYSRLRAWA